MIVQVEQNCNHRRANALAAEQGALARGGCAVAARFVQAWLCWAQKVPRSRERDLRARERGALGVLRATSSHLHACVHTRAFLFTVSSTGTWRNLDATLQP